MTRSSGYGESASAIKSSLTKGPYESAVSIKLTPSSTARRRTAIAAARSLGGPQIPSPVSRIAPKPRRLTVSSPPSVIVPPLAAERLVASLVFSFIFVLQNAPVYWMVARCDLTEVPFSLLPVRDPGLYGCPAQRQRHLSPRLISPRMSSCSKPHSAVCQLELRTLILGATFVVLGPRSFS